MAPRKTLIHNESHVPIFLIPHTFRNGDAHYQTNFPIKYGLGKKIPVGGPTEVDCNEYDDGEPDAGTKLCILFRAGRTDDGKDISSILKEVYPRGIKLEAPEKSLTHRQLSAKPHWYLSLQCIGVDNHAGQTSNAAGPQNQSELENLREKVRKLEEENKALKAALEKPVRK